MATEPEVQQVISDLLLRIGAVESSRRSLLPARRLVEIRCPDLDLVRYAEWRSGQAELLEVPPKAAKPDIRIAVDSDDLVRLAAGELSFGQAYTSGQLRVDASMSDLLRLRAAL